MHLDASFKCVRACAYVNGIADLILCDTILPNYFTVELIDVFATSLVKVFIVIDKQFCRFFCQKRDTFGCFLARFLFSILKFGKLLSFMKRNLFTSLIHNQQYYYSVACCFVLHRIVTLSRFIDNRDI